MISQQIYLHSFINKYKKHLFQLIIELDKLERQTVKLKIRNQPKYIPHYILPIQLEIKSKSKSYYDHSSIIIYNSQTNIIHIHCFIITSKDMQDSVKEMMKKFQGTYQHYKITLKLRQQSLFIALLDLHSLQVYELTIDQAYIDAKSDFTNIFEQPAEIIEFIAANFAEVVILENGIIRFEFKFAGLKKKAKVISIETHKKEQDKLEVIALKIEQVKEIFQGKLDEKEHKNLVLQGKVKQLETDNQNLRKDVEGLKKQTQRLAKILYNMLNLGYHPHEYDNKEHCEASLDGQGNVLRVRCTRYDSAFINKQQILPGKKVVFRVRLVNLQKKVLNFGIMSRAAIIGNEEKEILALAFEENKQFIFKGGQEKPVAFTMKNGDIVHIEADLVSNKVTWRNGEVSVEAELNEEMKNKGLFLMMVFKNQKDQVQLFSDG